jgi:hypothetical protein
VPKPESVPYVASGLRVDLQSASPRFSTISPRPHAVKPMANRNERIPTGYSEVPCTVLPILGPKWFCQVILPTRKRDATSLGSKPPITAGQSANEGSNHTHTHTHPLLIRQRKKKLNSTSSKNLVKSPLQGASSKALCNHPLQSFTSTNLCKKLYHHLQNATTKGHVKELVKKYLQKPS